MDKKRERVKIASDDGLQDKVIHMLYKTSLGRKVVKILINPIVSKAAGVFMDSSLSCFMIKPFIKKNKIDMSEYKKASYGSYNEFFTRQIKKGRRNFDMDNDSVCSPCDGKLTVYKIDDNSHFNIKGTEYTMKSLTRSSKAADYYKGGYVLIFRLCVDDYHRYAFIDSGRMGKNYRIDGVFHTVNPIAGEEYPIYKENTREFSVLNSDNFGKVLMMEVGAMMVGRIRNYNSCCDVRRGQEKGRFEFGGSTVVLAFSKDQIKIDEEILDNTSEGYETVVKMGEKIAVKNPAFTFLQ